MNILITICARKGSKRLPGKNTKLFHGKPLIQWTIEHALEFKEQFKGVSFENKIDIVVTTDIVLNEHLYNFLSRHHITRLKRNKKLCQDNTNKLNVIDDALNYMECKFKKKYDYIIDLDATAPLRKQYDIFKAFELFVLDSKTRNSLNLFSVVKARRIPWFNQIIVQRDGEVSFSSDFNFFKYPNHVYDLNASIYIYKPEFFALPISSPVRFNSMIYEMEEWQYVDIDTQTDWDVAEFLFAKYLLENKDE